MSRKEFEDRLEELQEKVGMLSITMKNEILAKNIFDQCDGSHYEMLREGKYEEYKTYMISRDVEMGWMQDKQNKVLNQIIE